MAVQLAAAWWKKNKQVGVTGKELMIVDLQGTYNKSTNEYILTDPVIVAPRQLNRFGPGHFNNGSWESESQAEECLAAIAHARKAGAGGAAGRKGIGVPARFRPTVTADSRSGMLGGGRSLHPSSIGGIPEDVEEEEETEDDDE